MRAAATKKPPPPNQRYLSAANNSRDEIVNKLETQEMNSSSCHFLYVCARHRMSPAGPVTPSGQFWQRKFCQQGGWTYYLKKTFVCQINCLLMEISSLNSRKYASANLFYEFRSPFYTCPDFLPQTRICQCQIHT